LAKALVQVRNAAVARGQFRRTPLGKKCPNVDRPTLTAAVVALLENHRIAMLVGSTTQPVVPAERRVIALSGRFLACFISTIGLSKPPESFDFGVELSGPDTLRNANEDKKSLDRS
jgi:hypothetical protein